LISLIGPEAPQSTAKSGIIPDFGIRHSKMMQTGKTKISAVEYLSPRTLN